jgi:hypothetical protein
VGRILRVDKIFAPAHETDRLCGLCPILWTTFADQHSITNSHKDWVTKSLSIISKPGIGPPLHRKFRNPPDALNYI